MAKKESKGTALILLGIVVIIAVVGVILLYSGAKTGKAYYYPYAEGGVYQYSTSNLYPSAREACLRAVHCQDGGGAILVSEPTQNPAICSCPEHFEVTTVFDWTALRRGEMPAPRTWNPNFVKKIIWQPQSQMYTTSGSRVYETPGTYQKLGTFNSY